MYSNILSVDYHKAMKRIIVRTMVLFSILFLLSFNIAATKMEEFSFMKEEIEKRHKNFFNTVSMKECQEEFERLMVDIDDSSIPDYYFTLSSFLALSQRLPHFPPGYRLLLQILSTGAELHRLQGLCSFRSL